MKIQLTLHGKVYAATLANNRTAREFAAMLPLTLTMHDFFGREKLGALPCAPGGISGSGRRTRQCRLGDMVCWAPGPDLTIFHAQDDRPVSGGLHFLGRIDFGAEAFGIEGPVEVHIDRLASTSAPRKDTTRTRDLTRPQGQAVQGMVVSSKGMCHVNKRAISEPRAGRATNRCVRQGLASL